MIIGTIAGECLFHFLCYFIVLIPFFNFCLAIITGGKCYEY
jgi:hypothetical protein